MYDLVFVEIETKLISINTKEYDLDLDYLKMIIPLNWTYTK